MSPTQVQNQEHRAKRFKCIQCDFSAFWPSQLSQHKVVHSDEKPFACSFPGCHYRTKFRSHIKEHELRHDPALSTRHKCPICFKGFCMLYQLNRHIRVHTQEKLKKCSQCDFKAVNYTGLISHKKKAHGIGKLAKRSQDSKYSKLESDAFQVKFRKVFEGGVTKFKCLFPGCEFKTKSKHHLPPHQMVHSSSRNVPCTFPNCEMRFKTSTALKSHMKSHDSNRPRNRECPMCSKKFLDSQGLKRHIKAHTGERAYQCPFCEYDSVENCNVHRHIRQHHPKDWIPGMPLTRKANFGVSHMNNALFRCEFCEFVGDSETSLLKHSVSHKRLTVNLRKLKPCSHVLTHAQVCTDCKAAKCPIAYTVPWSTSVHVPVVVLERLNVKFQPVDCTTL